MHSCITALTLLALVFSQCNPDQHVAKQGYDGEIYPHPTEKCPDYTTGVVKYRCSVGTWTKMNTCAPNAPSDFYYNVTDFELYINQPMVSFTPSIKCYGCKFDVKRNEYGNRPDLPEGIVLNEEDGTISGTPTALFEKKDYTITAINDNSGVEVVITFTVKDELSIVYPQPSYVLHVNEYLDPIIPVIVGKDYIVSVSPDLPEGLQLNQYDGAIYGTPVAEQETTPYIITVKSTNKTATVTLYISIASQDITYILIIAGCAVVICVLVIVVIVLSCKRRKSVYKMPTTSKN